MFNATRRRSRRSTRRINRSLSSHTARLRSTAMLLSSGVVQHDDLQVPPFAAVGRGHRGSSGRQVGRLAAICFRSAKILSSKLFRPKSGRDEDHPQTMPRRVGLCRETFANQRTGRDNGRFDRRRSPFVCIDLLSSDLVATAKNVYTGMMAAVSKANQTHKLVEVNLRETGRKHRPRRSVPSLGYEIPRPRPFHLCQ